MSEILIRFQNHYVYHILGSKILTTWIPFATDYLSKHGLFGGNMSINSIDHDDMTNIANKWDLEEEEINTQQPVKKVKSAEARRRIEALREIRESGLTIEEARELGILH